MVEARNKDPQFKAAYDELETDFSLLRELLAARRRAGLTPPEPGYFEITLKPVAPDSLERGGR
jgi:hypothetical protein